MNLLRTLILLPYNLWAYGTFIVLGLLSVLAYAIILLTVRHQPGRWLYFCNYYYARIWGALNGVRQVVKGQENLDRRAIYVICVNHRAIGDLFILPASLKGVNYRPLSKVELGDIPVIGYLFRKALVLIDRKDPASRKKGVDTLKKLMDNEGVSPLIFPEGTRNLTPAPLKPFYDGAFRIAIETQVPILPLVLLNIDKVTPPKSSLIRPGTLYCHILPAINTTGLTLEDVDQLKEQVFNLMWHETEAFIKTHGNR